MVGFLLIIAKAAELDCQSSDCLKAGARTSLMFVYSKMLNTFFFGQYHATSSSEASAASAAQETRQSLSKVLLQTQRVNGRSQTFKAVWSGVAQIWKFGKNDYALPGGPSRLVDLSGCLHSPHVFTGYANLIQFRGLPSS